MEVEEEGVERMWRRGGRGWMFCCCRSSRQLQRRLSPRVAEAAADEQSQGLVHRVEGQEEERDGFTLWKDRRRRETGSPC